MKNKNIKDILKNINLKKMKHQWFDITVDDARKYIYHNKGVLPEKFTNDNNGWKDDGDFFVVRNMRDD